MRGEIRNPWMVWAIILLTCGFGYLYFLYKWTDELKNALGRQDLNPTLELLVSLFFAPFSWYVLIRNGTLIRDAQAKAGLPNPEDKGVVMLLATCACGYGYVMVQEEMNKAWSAGVIA